MAEYLPPVVTILEGEIGDFLRMIAEAKGALDGLAASEDHVQHAMDAKSAAADFQAGRLENLGRTLELTAGANQFLMHAEQELGYRTTVTSVWINRQTNELTDLGNRMAITAGQSLAMVGVENNIAEAMSEKTHAALDQSAALDHLGSEAVGTAAKIAAIGAAEKGAAGLATAGIGAWAFWGISLTGWLTLIHTWLVLFGAQTAADVIGFAAFGAAAVKDIGPAVMAVGNLAKQYANLDPLQKGAAISLSNFVSGLQKVDELGVFGVFYQGLSLIKQAMTHLGGGNSIVTQATQAFSDFAAMLARDFKSSAWASLFAHGSSIIRKDLDALFGLFNRGIQLIPVLFHDFNGLGLAAIHAVGGFLHLTQAVLGFNPALTKAVALAGFGLGAYKLLWAGIGAGNGPLKAAYIGARNLAGSLAANYTAAGSLGGMFGGMVGTVGTLAGAFAAFLIPVGAAALIVANMGDSVSTNEQLFKQQASTLKNSATGYKALAAQVNQFANSYAGSMNQFIRSTAAGVGNNQILSQIRNMGQTFTNAAHNIGLNATNMARVLHVTRAQLVQFADTAGVDLTKKMKIGSAAFDTAILKLRGVARAAYLAAHPLEAIAAYMQDAAKATTPLTQKVNDLTAAFNTLLGPFASVLQDTVTWKQGNTALDAALDKTRGKINLNTKAGQAAAQALATQINNTGQLAHDQLLLTGNMNKAISVYQRQVAALKALHSNSEIVARAIKYLQQQIDGLHDKTITITANIVTSGSINVPIYTYPGGVTHITQKQSSTNTAQFANQGAIVNDIHVHLDGQQIFHAVQKRAIRRQIRSGTNGLQRITR